MSTPFASARPQATPPTSSARRPSPQGSRQNPALARVAWGLSQVQHKCPCDLSTTSAPLDAFLLQDALLWAPCGPEGLNSSSDHGC